MIAALIRWSVANRVLVLMATALLVFASVLAVLNTPVDALPDLSDTQVIVRTSYPGKPPQVVEDLVTYPLTTSLAGTPGVKTIRSMSGFGFSMVFVIFKDDVDYYWARSRVLERMNVAQQRLPEDVVPVLGPDATALGQVFWYTVEGEGFDLLLGAGGLAHEDVRLALAEVNPGRSGGRSDLSVKWIRKYGYNQGDGERCATR